ncbi:condensation domain-containing protein [Streptomyces sp. NPDC127033]|uniref:condensation domain-containing protein n=1 Tax=Streptomyces sp. NPDC127033 TaxID=3347110 RepID=UPI00365F1DC4
MTVLRTGADREDIAIVGIGLRVPGASSPEEFRAQLAAGRDSVGPMPPGRAEATGLDPAVRRLPMGHIEDIHTFDHAFHRLSRREATLIDPQHRMALTLAHRAIDDAGYSAAGLRGSETAVVFSAAWSGYHALTGEEGALGTLGNVPFGLPARIAHTLGLAGPCHAVDTGCNGSLIAVHHACRELTSGDAEYALAGGVSLRVAGLPAAEAAGFSELVSSSGRCRAFDADADGTVSGEGGAVLLLTTLRRAHADGAPVHAVIRGSATLHNGPTAATISAPSAAAQRRVIAKAWAAAGADPVQAGYLEAHGSGTRLGDAVELEAIAEAFAGRGEPLPIGSVKTNIGHLDHAAGIAGLVKAVLSVGHGELYPSLHFERPTGGLDLAAAGIDVVTKARAWPVEDGGPRLAGVSSFSLGGVNAHCVVAEPPAPPRPAVRRAPAGDSRPAGESRLVGVSARGPEALALLCGDLARALRDGEPDLDDVVFTLGQGRTHHAYRTTVTTRSTAELAGRLADRADRLRAGDHRPYDGGRPPAVALLLSPDALPADMPEGEPPPGIPATGRTGRVIAAQLAVFHALRDRGVVFDAVLGAGASRFAARHALGLLPARVEPAEFDAARSAPVDADELVRAARALLADGPVLFLEPSPDGALGRLLTERLAGQEGALVRVAHRFTDAVRALYEHGIDVDWAAVQPAAPGARRVRLPGHPMLGTPCWPAPVRPASVQSAPVQSAPVRPVPTAATDPADGVGWLRETLRDLLHAEEPIGPEDDFSGLGLNSLIALQLVDRIQARYGVRPKLIDVYERPRAADLARLLAPAPTAPGVLPPVVRGDAAVLSFGQERMWFHHQLDPGTTLYNLPMVSHVRGPLDVAALRGTWEDLAERHEVLRSNFVELDDGPALRIRPALGDFFRFADVSDAPDPVAAARELVREAAQVRFDLERDPLLRVLVVRLGRDEHVVQVTVHHAVNDGHSPKVFQRELPVLYAARQEGRRAELDPPRVRYRDYARWQRDLVARSALDHELAYWTERLRDAPVLALPTDHPRPPRKSFVGDLRPFTVPAPVVRALRELARRESVTLFVVLLTGLYVLLGRYSGQRDLVVGTPTTGRNRPELEGLIGFFNSTVALRADLSGGPSLRELLRRVRSVVLGALENQEIPFNLVVNALGVEKDLSRTPLFDVFYVHQQLPPIQPIGAAVGDFFDQRDTVTNRFGGMPAGTAKFDLTLVTTDREGEEDMAACLEFSTELFAEETAAELTAAYLGILDDLAGVTDTGRPVPGPGVAGGTPRPEPYVRSGPGPLPEVRVPADRPRPSPPVEASASATAVAGRPLPAGQEPDGVLLAAWLTLLAWYTGQDEVAVLVHAPRGPAAVRVDLSDEPCLTELTARLGRTPYEPLAPGAVPPPVRYAGNGTGADRSGAELSLSWAESGSGAASGSGSESQAGSESGPESGAGATGPALTVHYAPELFDASTAAAVAADLARLLAALVDRPGAPVHEVALDAMAGSQDDRSDEPDNPAEAPR